MQSSRSMGFLVTACLAATTLGGCAGLGSKPEPSQTDLQAPALPAHYEGAGDAPAAEPPPLAWWQGFGDAGLTEAVAQTLIGNADLRVANARVAQAQAVLAGTQAAGKPSMDLDASLSRARNSAADPSRAGQPGAADRNTTTARLGASLNWEWDVFGRQAQALSASQQRLLSQQAAEAATALTVAGEAARIVIEIRALQRQLRLVNAALDLDQESAEVAATRHQAGLDSEIEIFRSQALARSRAAQVQERAAALAQAQQSLAVLAGVTPQQVGRWLRLDATLHSPALRATLATEVEPPPWQQPAVLSVGLPSDLLRRRPDIIQAQARLREASAELAATQAERWPRFNLAAGLGWVAASVADLGTAGALAASTTPAVTWRVWEGGAIQAQIDERSAQEREALAAFTQTVMRAFAEAASAMRQLEQRRAEVTERELATRASAAAEQITQAQFKAGLTDWTKAQDARRASLEAQSAELLALQQQALSNVTLYRALGGGWQEAQRSTGSDGQL
jgi:outer membrane protein, multidrug efflux system